MIKALNYNPEPEDFDRVGDKLTEFTLAKGGPLYERRPFAFKAVNENGALAGEILGATVWGVAEVKLLHVEEQYRRQGIGKQLLAAAENFVRTEHKARGVKLWTPSFEGEGFYERAGYGEVARFPLHTEGHFEGRPQYHIVYYKSLESGA